MFWCTLYVGCGATDKINRKVVGILTNTADTKAEGTLSLRGATLNATLVRIQADARPYAVVRLAFVVNR